MKSEKIKKGRIQLRILPRSKGEMSIEELIPNSGIGLQNEFS